MSKIITAGVFAVVATVDVSNIEDLGLNTDDTAIVYECNGSYKSYQPGRDINAVTSISKGRGYIIIAKQQIDLTQWFDVESGGEFISSVSLANRSANTIFFDMLNDNDEVVFSNISVSTNSGQGFINFPNGVSYLRLRPTPGKNAEIFFISESTDILSPPQQTDISTGLEIRKITGQKKQITVVDLPPTPKTGLTIENFTGGAFSFNYIDLDNGNAVLGDLQTIPNQQRVLLKTSDLPIASRVGMSITTSTSNVFMVSKTDNQNPDFRAFYPAEPIPNQPVQNIDLSGTIADAESSASEFINTYYKTA